MKRNARLHQLQAVGSLVPRRILVIAKQYLIGLIMTVTERRGLVTGQPLCLSKATFLSSDLAMPLPSIWVERELASRLHECFEWDGHDAGSILRLL
jgi:hypothetical protein